MNFKLPKEVENLIAKFTKSDYQIYIVGGAVRDLLMKRGVHDWDFTTNATPEEILKVIPDGFYDNKFGTVGLKIGDDVYEITTMRKEGEYKDSRHPDQVLWTKDIKEDLARRDFTINALALDENLELVDPFEGQSDLAKKTIRTVGDPTSRFKEDALRLMRAIRIATELDFDIDQKTFDAIKVHKNLIEKVSWERIRDELFKILGSMNPYMGISKLREAEILQIILPELEKCFGIKQEGPKHDRIYDIGEHSLLSLKSVPSSDPLVRLAALVHDVGKSDTKFIQKDGNVTFYGHDVAGGKLVLKIAERLKLSNKQSDKLFKLVRFHMFTVDENQTDSAIRRFIKNVGLENIEDMFALRIGDRLGGGTQTETSWRMEKFKEKIKQVLHKPFAITDLKINGNDVIKELNIKPGPKVGEILNTLFQEVLDDSSKNNRDYLISRIKELGQ